MSVIKGLPLKSFRMPAALVKDLTPRKGLTIPTLNLSDLPVTDLAPLKEIKTDHLTLPAEANYDLTPLTGLTFRSIRLAYRPYLESDEKAITVPAINGKEAEEFWAEVEAGKKSDAEAVKALAGVKVEQAEVAKALAAALQFADGDITCGLENGRVAELHLNMREKPANVALGAFPAVRTVHLGFVNGRQDFAPLTRLPELESLAFPQIPDAAVRAVVRHNLPILKALPKLKTINGKPVKEVLAGK